MRSLVLVVSSLMLSGCASLNGVSVTPIPSTRENQVSASTERLVILGLNFDNDYADQVAADLARKCPGGKIGGILTKDETYYYFLFFVMKHKLTATGYCGRAGGPVAATASARGRRVNSVDADQTSEPQ